MDRLVTNWRKSILEICTLIIIVNSERVSSLYPGYMSFEKFDHNFRAPSASDTKRNQLQSCDAHPFNNECGLSEVGGTDDLLRDQTTINTADARNLEIVGQVRFLITIILRMVAR